MTSPLQGQSGQPLYIKVHPDDNVAIVVNSGGLPAGTVFGDGLTLLERVPQGHKVALADLARDAPILRYGEIIGYAEQAIARGRWIEESLVRLPALCQALAPHRNDATKPLRMMIMGIPNVGKSTLMNALVGYKIAKVGDEPAVTKMQQAHRLNARQTIIDTPGLMWPKIEHDSDGFMLAASHAIGRNAVIDEEVAVFLAGLLRERYPASLEARYGFPVGGIDAVGVIEGIAQRRALRMRGGAPDFGKASLVLLQDYRDGRLGRISLETPETRRAMLAVDGEKEAGKEAHARADTQMDAGCGAGETNAIGGTGKAQT